MESTCRGVRQVALDQSFGIDFGTTNSSVVQFVTTSHVGEFVSYGDDEGRPIPSIVAIDRETGEVHTGRNAWNRRSELEDTCECIPSIKRILDDDSWSQVIAGRRWTVVDVATEVFKALRCSAEKDGDEFDTATMAIPVGLNSKARKTLREAARRAGIEVKAFVSEPTAAFFANYDDLKSDKHVAIFDWGGGTLDVSILRHSDGQITELATSGMPIAGDHIDELMAQKVHALIARDKGVRVSFDDMSPRDKDMLIVRCERAKRALSEEDDTKITLNRYGDLGVVRKLVTYEWFEEVISSTVDKAIACLDKAIVESGEPEGNIDRVVMVGGSSNLGPLYDRLERRFGDKLFFPEETVWNISEGASLLAHQPGNYAAAQDVGVILADGSYYPLLRTGELVEGWHKSVDFGITDTSDMLRVVFSGSRDIDSDEQRLRLVDVPGYRFLEERLRLDAAVDNDLVFRVRMKSSMRPNRDAKVWEYGKLKLSYGMKGWSL